jgi:hypothetical protein
MCSAQALHANDFENILRDFLEAVSFAEGQMWNLPSGKHELPCPRRGGSCIPQNQAPASISDHPSEFTRPLRIKGFPQVQRRESGLATPRQRRRIGLVARAFKRETGLPAGHDWAQFSVWLRPSWFGYTGGLRFGLANTGRRGGIGLVACRWTFCRT